MFVDRKSLFRVVFIVLLVVLIFGVGGTRGIARPAYAATFTVDSIGDGADANTADSVCDDGAGNCTLRAAIQQANANVGPDIIGFNIPGAGAQVIVLGSALPSIDDALIIAGSTQTDYVDTPLIVADANGIGGAILTVNAADVTLEDLRISNAAGTAVQINGPSDNAVVDNLDVRWTASTSKTGNGIYVNGNPDNVIIQNSRSSTRSRGVWVNGASDVQILNNELVENATALFLQSITANTLPGGVIIASNDYTASNTPMYFNNMADLVISDGSVGGTNVDVTDGGGNETLTNAGAAYALQFNSVDNVLISDIDLSWTTTSSNNGYGIRADSSMDTFTVQNVTINNRTYGLYLVTGSDVTVTDNNLEDNSSYAIYLWNVTQNALPGGVFIEDNSYTGSSNGLYLRNMMDITISDGSVGGTNVDVTDGGGVETLQSVPGSVLQFYDVDNLHIENIDLTWTGDSVRRGTGIRSDSTADTVLIQNNVINNRASGLSIYGGSDVQVLNNNLDNNNSWALELTGITPNTIPEAIVVDGNSYTDSSNGVRLAAIANLIISDGSVPGTDVDLTDGGGVHTLNTVIGTALEINNLDNVQVDMLDLSWTGDATRRGTGFNSANSSDTVLIQNLTINNRQSGLSVNGGSDVQILNNNLDNNFNRALQLSSITSTVLPGGVFVADNSYSNSANAVYLSGLNNITISDGSVGGTNVDLTDIGGVHTLNTATGTALFTSNVDNLVVDQLDLSWTGDANRRGTGLDVVNGDTVLIQNLQINVRNTGIYVQGGSNVQVNDNDLSDNGGNQNNPALYLNGINGVTVADNDYSNSGTGVRLNNMSNHIISDGSVGGTTIDLTDGGGNHTLTTASSFPLYLDGLDDSTIAMLDLSWTGSAIATGYGLYSNNNSDNLIIQDNTIDNRAQAVYVSGGSDVQVLDNVLTNATTRALELRSIGSTLLPGGIDVAGNDYSGSTHGIYLVGLTNITVSDGSVVGTNLDVTDGGGNQTLTSNFGTALQVSNVDNLTVDSIDLSWTGDDNLRGTGFDSQNNSDTVLLQNLTVNNRTIGVQVNGGTDVQVLNNDLGNSGGNVNQPSLYLSNITSSSLPGGVQVAGNDFSYSSSGVRLDNMDNMIVSDGSVPGTHIDLTDGNGNHTLTTVSSIALMVYNDSDDITISNLDLSWYGSGSRSGSGIYFNYNGGAIVNDNPTIQNVVVQNRGNGMYFQVSNTININCSFIGNNNDGLYVEGNVTTITAVNNHFSGNTRAIRRIGAAAPNVIAENNYWGAADGSVTDGGSGDAYSGNVDAIPFLAAVPPCAPLSEFVVTTTADTIDGDTSTILALMVDPGADEAISLREAIIATNNTIGPDTITFDIGGGGPQTIVLTNTLPAVTDPLTIQGGSQPGFVGVPIITIDANGTGGTILPVTADNTNLSALSVINAPGTAVSYNGITGGNLINVDVSGAGGGTGLEVTNSTGVSANYLTADNRTTGVNAANSTNLFIGCSYLQTNTTGLNADAVSSAVVIFNSHIQGNTTGVNNAAAGVLLAEDNYWGTADGSSSDTGTGDSHSGNVDGVPFLAAPPACLTTSAFVVNTVFDVNDGDTSSIANLVATPGSDGFISLREAIIAANNTVGADTINFNIGGGGSHTIVLSGILPVITEDILIDGSSQPGFSGTPLVTLDAGLLTGNIMELAAPNSTLNDFAILNGSQTILTLNDADNAVVDGLNLSWTDVGQIGTGLSVANDSQNVLIQNLTVHDRDTGIVITGGEDVQVLNNDLSGSGNNSNQPALFINNVSANLLSRSVIVSGNTFAGASVSLRLDSMDNQIISDGLVLGTNITILPGDGLQTASAYPIYLRGVTNSFVENLDLSWVGVLNSGTGMQIDNSSDTVTIRNNVAMNRVNGLDISNSTDIHVLDNNLQNNSSYALTMNGITANALTGGVNIAGNDYSDSSNGVYFTTMSNLLISDGSVGGTNVDLSNGGGVETLQNVPGLALRFYNVDDSVVDTADLSWFGLSWRGTGFQSDNFSDNLIIQNVVINQRNIGIQISGGSDVQLLNNDLSDTGANVNNPALYLTSIGATTLPRSIIASGNIFANANIGIRMDSIPNQIISDGSVPNTNFTILPGDGLQTSSGIALYMRNMDNLAIENLDLSWPGIFNSGTGIDIQQFSDTVMLRNNTITHRQTAIYVFRASDVQVLDNNLQDSSTRALEMSNVTANSLPGGTLIQGNDYSDSGNGVYLTTMSDLIISDGSVALTNVDLTDGGGAETLQSVSGNALQFNNVDNTIVDNLNLSWSGLLNSGIGFYSQNSSDNLLVQNLVVNNRQNGIYINGGTDAQVLNNDLTGSGTGQNNPALYLVSISSGSLPGGVLASGNMFGDTDTALRLENLSNVVVSDGSAPGTNVTILPGDGLQTAVSHPLYVRNFDDSLIDSLDLSNNTPLAVGFGVYAYQNSNNLTIQNSNMDNRQYGVYSYQNTNISVYTNTLSNAATNGLYMQQDNGATVVAGNDFTNDTIGINLVIMSNITIGSATGLDSTSGIGIRMDRVTDSVVDGIDLSFNGPEPQGTGLHVEGNTADTITLTNSLVENREIAVNFLRGNDLNITCSRILDNEIGVLAGQSGSSANNPTAVDLNNNWFQDNLVAVENPDRDNPTPPPPTIPDPEITLAENNYWGVEDGPQPLGGSGDTYVGAVDADPFEVAVPLCIGADYGDLPASYNQTLAGDSGAIHRLGNTYLGLNADFESDGQVSADAGRTAVDGDDGNKLNDEDGVSIVGQWQDGVSGGEVEISVTGENACLSAWVDWGNDSSFVEAGDQVLDMVPVTPGINNVSFDIPAGSLPYDGIYNWFSRFRLVRDLNIQGDCSDDAALTVGGIFLNGEVEDHYLFMDRESPTGTGPGGVGTNDATSALALWLNASAISQTNGSLVTDWSDLSGFDYHAAGAGASAPTYQQSVINGQAVVRFDNVDDGMLISDTLSLDAPYAAFVVYNNTAAPASAHRALQGQDNNWFMGFDSSSLAHFAGGFVANTVPLNPSQFYIAGANNFNLFSFYRLDGVDQTDSAGFVGFPGRLSLGADGVTADPLGGDIAEVIVYHHGLNTARMFIVENYLSSKYEIVIPGAVDKYDGDTPAENHFDLDVAGIGQEADGDNDNAHSRGIVVVDETYLQNNGDYLLFGHNSLTNLDGNPADHPTTAEWLAAADPVIWERHWYFDRNDISSNGGTVTIAFDFSEGDRPGVPLGPVSNYRLLGRPTTGVTFDDITFACTTSTSFNGDQVVFSGVDVTCLGSNFTLGSLDNTTSPTAVSFLSVNLGHRGNSPALILLASAFVLGLITILFLRQERKLVE